MTRLEEIRLIGLAAEGDRHAAEAFIRAHQRSLYLYLLRLCGKPELAEDITQEAFVRVLTHLERFDTRFRFSTWLFTIAKRLLVNASQKFKPAYDSETVGGLGSGICTAQDAAQSEEEHELLRCALQRALMALPEQQREIVLLFHQVDWPISSIAQYLEMPEGTVKSHLHRARRRLREILSADPNTSAMAAAFSSDDHAEGGS